jgi:hypothetical protein
MNRARCRQHCSSFTLADFDSMSTIATLDMIIALRPFRIFLCTVIASISLLHADESDIHCISVGPPPYPVAGPQNSNGDTWMPAWTADGSVFSPGNDTHGFGDNPSSNINFNRIDGTDPTKLTGETLNRMTDFGNAGQHGPDNCTWKSSGFLALDGTLYWAIARHEYGEESGDNFMRQDAHDGSIIKSTDQGKTWTRSAQDNYDHPEFPGTSFVTPYFVNYGQEGHEAVADGSDKWVYATSNNGYWDSGDYMVLARCLRSDMPKLDRASWSYYSGGDGSQDSAWTKDRKGAKRIIDDPDRVGETGATYLPVQKAYLMITWYYPQGSGKISGNANKETVWQFRVASHPWGPWRTVSSQHFSPAGYYCPGICPKFSSADGTKAWVFCAGDWTNGQVYRLTSVPITFQ